MRRKRQLTQNACALGSWQTKPADQGPAGFKLGGKLKNQWSGFDVGYPSVEREGLHVGSTVAVKDGYCMEECG